MTGDVDEPARFLFIDEYSGDAERKRVEYLLNNWSDGTIERADGSVRIAEGVGHEELSKQIVSKIPTERVDGCRMERTDTEPEITAVETTIGTTEDIVETLGEYMRSVIPAVLWASARAKYEVHIKKGRTEVSNDLIGQEDGTYVRARSVGLTPAGSFPAGLFQTELEEYAANQQPD